MRFRQLKIRYTIQGSVVRYGDPWTIRLPLVVARPEWRPPVDLFETSSELIVKVEVAGMSEEDFEILLYEDILVIQGERPWKLGPGEARFYLAEIHYGPFRLELPVAATIDRDQVSARYENGFLLVTLPKGEVPS